MTSSSASNAWWFGWEKTRELVEAFFRDKKARFLWIHGPTGSGKSYVARTVAKRRGYTIEPFVDPDQCLPCMVSDRGVLWIDDVSSAIAFFPEFERRLLSVVKDSPKTRFFFTSTTEAFYFQFRKRWPAHFFTHVVRTFPPFAWQIRRHLQCSRQTAQACHGDVRKARLMQLLSLGSASDEIDSSMTSAQIMLGYRRGPLVEKNNRSRLALSWAFDNYGASVTSLDDLATMADKFSTVDYCRETLPSLKVPCTRPQRVKMSRQPKPKPKKDLRGVAMRLLGPSTAFGRSSPELWRLLSTFDVSLLRTMPTEEFRAWAKNVDFRLEDRLLLHHAFSDEDSSVRK